MPILRQLAFFGLAMALSAGAAAAPATKASSDDAASGWAIDENLRIHLVYLPADGASAPAKPLEPLLQNVKPFSADITNIVYKNILGMGFPLPTKPAPESLKLYLKFFRWPRALDQRESAARLFGVFALGELPRGRALFEYVRAPEHVFLKYALVDAADRRFTSESPFPSRPPGSQEELNGALPFSSIYVKPARTGARPVTELERARASAQGVVAFRQELAALYARIFRLWSVDAKTGDATYVQTLRCPDDPGQVCGLRTYELPGAPLVFSNYVELPMPQDPQNVFVSGLLLVKATESAARTPVAAAKLGELKPDEASLRARFQPIWSHMLEVGSVYDRRKR